MPLFVALVLLSILVIARRRRSLVSVRGAAVPAVVAAGLALFVVGFPQLHYGLAWLSFSSDDMTNYALNATRLVRLPEFAEPQLANLVSSTHPDEFTWFIFAKNGDRYGFDLVLALVGAITSRSPFDVYMSLELALHFCGALATAAIFAKDRSVAAVTFIAGTITLAPANAMSVYYQLGPQVGGIALLAATFYFFTRTRSPGRRDQTTTVALGAIVFAGLLHTYPEVVSILAVALFFCGVRLLWPLTRERLRPIAQTFSNWVIATVAGVTILGPAGVSAVLLFITRLEKGATLNQSYLSDIFNTSLTPSGMAALFGIVPIDTYVMGPFASADVVLSLVLFALATLWATRSYILGATENVPTLVFAGLFVSLIVSRSGYGAFKTILYAQPFLFGTLGEIALSTRFRGWFERLPLAAYTILYAELMTTLYYNVQRSDDPLPSSSGAYTTIPNASASNLLGDLHEIAKKAAGHTLVTESNVESLSKIENGLLPGISMRFPSHDPFFTLESYGVGAPGRLEAVTQSPILQRDGVRLLNSFYAASRDREPRPLALRMPVDTPACCPVEFRPAKAPPIGANALLLYSGSHLTVFNRSSDLPNVRSVGLFPYAQASNILVFVDSTLGVSLNFGLNPVIFEMEPDYFFPGHTMSATGRYLLFEIIHPKRARLEFWFTRSYNLRDQSLPDYITIYGAGSQRVRLGGSGSTRIVSQPLAPAVLNGHYYIAIDFRKAALPTAILPTSGLALLYNADLIKDRQLEVGYARDISVISDATFSAGTTPQVLSTFPADLQPCCLQYSGVYEDGWVSKDSWFELRSDRNSDALVVEGSVPAGVAVDTARVDLDGQERWKQPLVPGTFSFTIPVSSHLRPGNHRIELHFSNSRILGSGDARSASALLEKVGFQAN
jgi:hypothetical protein